MAEFYDEARLEPLEKKIRFWRAFLVVFLVLALGGAVACFCCIHYANKNVMVPLTVAYMALACLLSMFFLCYFLLPYQAMSNRIKEMNEAYKRTYVGTFLSESDPTTLRKGVLGEEVSFQVEGKKMTFFLEESEAPFAFEAGKEYQVEVADNFLVTAKEANHVS